MALGKDIMLEKGKGETISKMLRLLGRISSGEDNKGLKKWGWGRISRLKTNGDGEENQDFKKMWMRKKIKF